MKMKDLVSHMFFDGTFLDSKENLERKALRRIGASTEVQKQTDAKKWALAAVLAAYTGAYYFSDSVREKVDALFGNTKEPTTLEQEDSATSPSYIPFKQMPYRNVTDEELEEDLQRAQELGDSEEERRILRELAARRPCV